MTRCRSSTHVGQAEARDDIVDRQNAACASVRASLIVTTSVKDVARVRGRMSFVSLASRRLDQRTEYREGLALFGIKEGLGAVKRLFGQLRR